MASGDEQCDVCVIGAGLIGSAAAKYLAARGLRVVLAGADEAGGAKGACYDEGRIYRVLDPDPVWAELAKVSISRYPTISAEAGGRAFFEECGFLVFGDPETSYIRETRKLLEKERAAGMAFDVFHGREGLERRFPWLRLPSLSQDWVGLFQPKGGGHLSPRLLQELQAHIAGAHGASWVREEVAEVAAEHAATSTGGAAFDVHCSGGRKIRAGSVLLAAGAKSSLLSGVLPHGSKRLDVDLLTSQALLLEVDEGSVPDSMPAMIYHGPEDPAQAWYILPPIRYPDGKLYLKMGYDGMALRRKLATQAEVDAWFARRVCDAAVSSAARQYGRPLFPNIGFTGDERHVVCVTDFTCPQAKLHRPFLDMLSPGFFVATGGCGWAGKSADQIGWLASEMVANASQWTTDPAMRASFPREDFRAHFRASL